MSIVGTVAKLIEMGLYYLNVGIDYIQEGISNGFGSEVDKLVEQLKKKNDTNR